MKKLIIFCFLVLLFTSCSDDDTQDGLSDHTVLFEPNRQFFNNINESVHLIKGDWIGTKTGVNGSILEFPIPETGEELGRIHVFDPSNRAVSIQEFNLVETTFPGVIEVDQHSGVVRITDPTTLVFKENSYLRAEIEAKIGNKSVPFTLNLKVEELTNSMVINYSGFNSFFNVIPAYPYLKSGVILGKTEASANLGTISYSLSPEQSGLIIDPLTGKISIKDAGHFNLENFKSQAYEITIQVSHEKAEKKWKKTIPGMVYLSNAGSEDCNINNPFMFSATDAGENFNLLEPDGDLQLEVKYQECFSDEYTFVLSQPKLLCQIVSWSPDDYRLILELTDISGEVLFRANTDEPTIIDTELYDGWDYNIYSSIKEIKVPYLLEAGKKYTIKRSEPVYETIDYGFYTGQKKYYASQSTGTTFPVKYGDITILGAKYNYNGGEKSYLNGIPLIDLHFSN